jgi:ribosome-associated toxin RatA of RatAB toxin-antitoxin module
MPVFPSFIFFRRARLLLGTLAFTVGSALAASPGKVEVERTGDAVQVHATALLEADAATVWNTLIGYEQLPDFIPDMSLSKTLKRDGNNAVVQQNGRAGLGPFKRDFTLTLDVREEPMNAVFASARSGDFAVFESSYRLVQEGPGRIRLNYLSRIEPRDGIPPLVGVPIMRLAIQRQFDALVTEIGRRATLDGLALKPIQ